MQNAVYCIFEALSETNFELFGEWDNKISFSRFLGWNSE